MSAIDRARTLANMNERAKRLLSDGYRIQQIGARLRLQGYQSDVHGYWVERPNWTPESGEPLGYIVWLSPREQSCQCKAFSRYDECKHIYACQLWEEEQAMAAMVAQYEAEQAAALFADDYAVLSDRAEREIRETGYCPF